MIARSFTLAPGQVQELRARHPVTPDQSWVPDVVRTHGWAAANVRYLEGERQRSFSAMKDLLSVLGVDKPRDPDEAIEILALAFEVFAPETGFAGLLRRDPGHKLYVKNRQCPTNALMESQRCFGVTACASWHRRRGWFDALQVDATDSIYSEQRWGSPACSAVLCVYAVLPQDATRPPFRHASPADWPLAG
ncbi:MAG: hypothetical protein EPO16_07425 [Dehalococcoidia bacterium]|nr:MAG: hypothetical protein EPO16_07425 [Dehalococcoidia bacterium]